MEGVKVTEAELTHLLHSGSSPRSGFGASCFRIIIGGVVLVVGSVAGGGIGVGICAAGGGDEACFGVGSIGGATVGMLLGALVADRIEKILEL